MKRNEFGTLLLGLAGLSVLTGCKSRISKSAFDESLGEPYRCTKCGHLIRSKEDLTGTRCPRCYSRRLVKISEEEMAEFLREGAP